MAYVLWRVFMKKYSRVRLGLHKTPVTPVGRHFRAIEESSWRPFEDELDGAFGSKTVTSPTRDELSRCGEERQSKSKRVKNYLKKCKDALSGHVNKSDRSSASDSAYWYLDNSAEVLAENVLSDSELLERTAPDCSACGDGNVSVETLPVVEAIEAEVGSAEVMDSSPSLPCAQTVVEEPTLEEGTTLETCLEEVEDTRGEPEAVNEVARGVDVASLVDELLAPLYHNYERTRAVLVRQARDLLVCEYLGNLTRFELEFCRPAAKLLAAVKLHTQRVYDAGVLVPRGWPLSLGPAGVLVHLGPLPLTLLRTHDAYLCVRSRSAAGLELALIHRTATHTLAELSDPLQPATITHAMDTIHDMETAAYDELDGQNLPNMLQNLLVSVERALERVPLDDLVFPCSQCAQYQPLADRPPDATLTCACECSCSLADSVLEKKDMSMQTSPMFEFAGAIPHIDSDEDDEKDACRTADPTKRPVEIVTPKTISQLPEKLLMSGVNLPGTQDKEGRPLVVWDAPCVTRSGLNHYEIATLLLYYASIPSKERMEKGFTILVLAETPEDATLTLLDKTILLILPHIKINSILIWKPGAVNTKPSILSNSKIQTYVVADEPGLQVWMDRTQAPASCGGSCTHDQLEWVEFFRELEPFVDQCQIIGRAMLVALADIRDQEVPAQIGRRFLHHQLRQLSRALQEPGLQTLRHTGASTVESLSERAQWLTGSEDVRKRTLYARYSFKVADKVAERLEHLAAERRALLEELARLRALEDEANKILSWLRTEGNDTLQQHISMQRRATTLVEIKQHDQEFEKFYFNAMRQIDKVADLLEVSNHCQSSRAKKFKELMQVLKQQINVFSGQLEDVRQLLEDTARCFDVFMRYQSGVGDPGADVAADMVRLATKCGNEKLMDLCQSFAQTNQDSSCALLQFNPEGATSTPVRAAGAPHRRRSVSSFAFIYKCNHHAAGMACDCWDDHTDENTESAKLKKKYVQSLQECACVKNALDRKNSLGLDNIQEVRESVEDLLASSEKNDSGVSGCGRCDSSVSTGNASSVYRAITDDVLYKKRLQRTSSCQFCNESSVGCSGGSSSGGSHGDHTDHQQYSLEESDIFPKSTGSEELEEVDDRYHHDRTKSMLPVSVNSHLHCRASTLDLPNIQDHNLDPKIQKTLLLILREMIQTERDYVKSLYYVIENYIPELLRQDIPQALRGQRNVVFGNIEKIYEFHSQQFLRELELCEDSPLHVGQIFLRHTSKFSLYALYNKNKPKSDSLMSEYGRYFFKSKQLHLNDNLDLASYLLKPVQRMGKYALLLQQLMKACPELPEGSSERAVAEREDLVAAEDMVRFQLRHGNDLLAMDSIRDCDVNLKEQGRLLRQNEFLVSEGRGGKKSFRQVFLFEELILFSKAKRFPDRKNLDLYIYKNSIKMTDIGLTAKIGDSPTKFEIWFRKRKPNDTFTLQAMTQEVKKAWTEELSKLLWKQAMKNREIRLQEMSSMGIGNKPCLDIRPSADQINDRSISIAQLTKTAPKFRNSIVGPVSELCRSSNRPHSIISVSSTSSGSTSSQGSGGTLGRHMTAAAHINHLVFDNENTHTHHRSHTINSQCSIESGIIADISLGSDDCPEPQLNNPIGWPLQKSSSQHSNISGKVSTANSVTQTEEQQITLVHIPDEDHINI